MRAGFLFLVFIGMLITLVPSTSLAEKVIKQIIVTVPDQDNQQISVIVGEMTVENDVWNSDDFWNSLRLGVAAASVVTKGAEFIKFTGISVRIHEIFLSHLWEYRMGSISGWECFRRIWLTTCTQVAVIGLSSAGLGPYSGVVVHFSTEAVNDFLDLVVDTVAGDVPTVTMNVDGEYPWKKIYLDASITADVTINIQVESVSNPIWEAWYLLLRDGTQDRLENLHFQPWSDVWPAPTFIPATVNIQDLPEGKYMMWVFAVTGGWNARHAVLTFSQFILDHWQEGVSIFGQKEVGQGIVQFDIVGDLDRDGLPDNWELRYWPDITVIDPDMDDDGDGLTNMQEYREGTNPTIRDTDAGGESDGNEVSAGTYPLDPRDDQNIADSDGDRLPDVWEQEYWGNLTTVNDSGGDHDGDGLTNAQEYQIGTDPTKQDTDDDGVSDGAEIVARTNPLDPSDGDGDGDGLPDPWERQYWGDTATVNNLNGDEDGDGLTNIQEYQEGTDPTEQDTDGGGASDGDEVAAGADPLDPNDDQILTNAPLRYTGDTTVDYLYQVYLEAKLTDDAGNLLPSQEVEFVIGTGQSADEVIGITDKFTAFTDFGGVARIYDAVPSTPPGVYRIQARFEGTQTYEPSRSMPTRFVVTMNIYGYDQFSPPLALHIGPGYPTGPYSAGGPLYGDPPMGQTPINQIPIHCFSTDLIKLESGAQVVYSFDSPIASEAGNIAYVYLLINATMAFPEMYGSKVGTVNLSFDDNSEESVHLYIGDNVRHWWSGNNYMRYVNEIQSDSTKPAWWSPRWADPDIPPQYGQEYFYLDMMQIAVPAGKNLREVTIASENLIARGLYNVGLRIMGIQVIHRNWIPSSLQPEHLAITGIYSPFVYMRKAYLAQAAIATFVVSYCQYELNLIYSLFIAYAVEMLVPRIPVTTIILPIDLLSLYTVYLDMLEGVRLLNLANDPTDYNYTTVVEPAIYTRPRFQPSSPDEQTLVDLMDDKIRLKLQISSYLEAIYVSMNRYSTAMADGDSNSAELQLAAIGSYSESVNLMMQQSNDLTQPIIRAWKEARWPNPSVTESDVIDIQTRLETSGFPDDEKQLFEKLGLTSNELDEIKDALVSMDPEEAKGDFLTSLAKSADASKLLSDTFASIAEEIGSQTTLTIPTVVSNWPAASEERIALDAGIKVEFTGAMDFSTINTGTFILTDEQANIVPCEVTYVSETQTALAQPLANLNPLAEYTVTLNTGIQDAAGNPLPWDWTWTFTTSGDKIYGGGWVSQDGFRASFSLKVASLEGIVEPGSYLKYFDQQTRTAINASSIDSLGIVGNRAIISGSCTVNDVSGYYFSSLISNSAPDGFSLEVVDSQGNLIHSKSGDLAGGNLIVESVILSSTP